MDRGAHQRTLQARLCQLVLTVVQVLAGKDLLGALFGSLRNLVDIDVNIYCERESHKGMVIGKGGAMLKKIASSARADCEEFLGCRVNLQCWVKVKADWRDNEFLLNNFGFKQNPNNR